MEPIAQTISLAEFERLLGRMEFELLQHESGARSSFPAVRTTVSAVYEMAMSRANAAVPSNPAKDVLSVDYIEYARLYAIVSEFVSAHRHGYRNQDPNYDPGNEFERYQAICNLLRIVVAKDMASPNYNFEEYPNFEARESALMDLCSRVANSWPSLMTPASDWSTSADWRKFFELEDQVCEAVGIRKPADDIERLLLSVIHWPKANPKLPSYFDMARRSGEIKTLVVKEIQDSGIAFKAIDFVKEFEIEVKKALLEDSRPALAAIYREYSAAYRQFRVHAELKRKRERAAGDVEELPESQPASRPRMN